MNFVNRHVLFSLLLSIMQCPILFRASLLGSSFTMLIVSATFLHSKVMFVF